MEEAGFDHIIISSWRILERSSQGFDLQKGNKILQVAHKGLIWDKGKWDSGSSSQGFDLEKRKTESWKQIARFGKANEGFWEVAANKI